MGRGGDPSNSSGRLHAGFTVHGADSNMDRSIGFIASASHLYRFCPSPTRRIRAIGALRRDLSTTARWRQSEARNPVNECNVGTSAISFRTASSIRSNSISLITRSKAPGRHSVARSVRGPALSRHHHASLLFEGSATVASMAKKGRNREGQARASRKRWFRGPAGATAWPNLPDAC